MVKKLTQDLVRKLRDRRNLKPADRANLDYKMAKKLDSGLDELAGLLYIMEALPPNKIKPSIDRKDGLKDEHVRLLLKVTESALRILEYKKVRGPANNPYILEEINRKVTGVEWKTGKLIKHGEFHRKRPQKKEIDRGILLWNHVDYLIKEFVPETNSENPGKVRSLSIEDHIDEQMWQEDKKKIEERFASGMEIDKIAAEIGHDSFDVLYAVYEIQENERESKRRIERLKQDITDLEHDEDAIERIKELWKDGWRNRTAIAVEINHSRSALTSIIDKMIESEEIAKD